LEIGSDIGCELALTSLPRLRHERAAAPPREAPFADAALAWSAMYAAAANGSRSDVLPAFDVTVRALRACEPLDASVTVLLARCFVTMSPVLHELAGTGRARAAAERESALVLALGNALPRTMWICLYLSVFENIWRDDLTAALGDAQQLFASVRASDSLLWNRIARSRLSNACSAVGLLDDAERAIAPLGAGGGDGDPGLALQRCALTFRRARYRETLVQASALVSAVADRAPHYHANALLYSAGAAYRLADTARATADIVDAVGLFESSYSPTLFLAMRAFRLAYTITGRPRYDDAARDLQNAFEALETPARESPAAERLTAGESAALTPRQSEIVRLAADGATNRAIAAALGISARTVGNHLAAAYAALGVRARWQLRGRVEAG
jgi:DNA-binding CsgD family transcriptional regulator